MMMKIAVVFITAAVVLVAAFLWFAVAFIHVIVLPLALLMTGVAFLCIDGIHDVWRLWS